jgi:hypothetical protein
MLGSVCLRTGEAAADLVVDVIGSFGPSSSYAGVMPARLADPGPGASTVDDVSAGSGLVEPPGCRHRPPTSPDSAAPSRQR